MLFFKTQQKRGDAWRGGPDVILGTPKIMLGRTRRQDPANLKVLKNNIPWHTPLLYDVNYLYLQSLYSKNVLSERMVAALLRDLLNKLLAIWQYLKRMRKSLWTVMRLRKFWMSQGGQILILWIIVGFWTSQGYGVLHDSPPPFMWISSALVAISAFAWLTADQFFAAETEFERFLQGMLLLQTVVIIIGNSTVIVMEAIVGIRFTQVDWVIVATDAVGLCYMGWRMRRGDYDWKSPKARRDATTSLKAIPQFVMAVGILFGLAKQGPLAIGFLLSQCLGRWWPTRKARQAERKRGETSDKTAAQFATTSIDGASAVIVAACNWVF